ncbi:hypothetical protein OPT61_g8019 [Boeremia exigua]|uniref:Uncharacterized protein n=1 Tax=Boeremia exigua TaxID=749465 RepID=A0ACC2I114_9PLEO|nr:hypothetical protein OPT61_g8019 [Boeremia exigua]
MAQAYCHRRLDYKSSSIRLLRVEKTQSPLIVLSVRHANLDDKEPFNALSYAWGAPSPLYSITIQDGDESASFNIRQNLYDFLSTARDSEDEWATTWLWIDQICINQSNHEERCHQVAQMAEIYSTASSTIVWPGLTQPKHDGKSDLPSSNLLLDETELDIMRQSSVVVSEFVRGKNEPVLPSEAAISLIGMINNPLLTASYWSRLWIIQEIVLASRVNIVIAGKVWHFVDFHMALAILVERLEKCPDSRFTEDVTRSLQALRAWVNVLWLHHTDVKKDYWSRTWHSLYLLASQADCESRFDRIYGVMALVQKGLQVHPDYTISQRRLLRAILEKQILFPPFPEPIWEVLFNTLFSWTECLYFKPIESVGSLPRLIHVAGLDRDVTVQKYIVQLVLKDLRLPQPTVILEKDEWLHWSCATSILIESYTQRTSVEVCFSNFTGTNIHELSRGSLKYQVLKSIRLQKHIIEECEKRRHGRRAICFYRRTVLSATRKGLQGRAKRSKDVRVRRFAPTATSTANQERLFDINFGRKFSLPATHKSRKGQTRRLRNVKVRRNACKSIGTANHTIKTRRGPHSMLLKFEQIGKECCKAKAHFNTGVLAP